MSYTGKYALAKHETLALKCEHLERKLEEAISLINACLIELHYEYDHDTVQLLKNRFEQLKESG